MNKRQRVLQRYFENYRGTLVYTPLQVLDSLSVTSSFKTKKEQHAFVTDICKPVRLVPIWSTHMQDYTLLHRLEMDYDNTIADFLGGTR